jgi:hypothetical protein
VARTLKNWIVGYTEYTEQSESPDSFHFWTAVFTIAGALRRQVWIEQRYFQWTPNFYIVLVGPPGIAAKSTSVRIGVKLLEQIPGVNLGPQSITWQSLTKSLSESVELIKMPDEKFHPMSCISIPVGELGTFLQPDDRVLVDVLVSLWDGQQETWGRSTKTQGSDKIENPWINVIGATTPSWLRDNFPETMITGGLTSRVIFVFGDEKRHFVPYPADVINEAEHLAHSKILVHDLIQISQMRGEMYLTPEAKEWGKAWYKQHWTMRPTQMASERFSGYIARKQTHIHKLAMVLSASENNDLSITLENLTDAENMVTQLEAEMFKVFDTIGNVPATRHLKEITNYLQNFGKLEKKTLWRYCCLSMSLDDFYKAIDACIAAHWLQQTQFGSEIYYTPTKELYERDKKEEET